MCVFVCVCVCRGQTGEGKWGECAGEDLLSGDCTHPEQVSVTYDPRLTHTHTAALKQMMCKEINADFVNTFLFITI